MTFEVHCAVKTPVAVMWVVTPCGHALALNREIARLLLRDNGTHPKGVTTSQHGRPAWEFRQNHLGSS